MEKKDINLHDVKIGDLAASYWVRGFTLVEVMVALTLFIVAVSIAITGFLVVLRTDHEIGSFIQVETNTELTLEQMAREIRTGRSFSSGSVSSQLQFTNSQNINVLYCLATITSVQSILRVTGAGATCDGAENKITADDVSVSALSFVIRPIGGLPNLPPRITITLTVAPVIPSVTVPPVNLETTVSARNF